MRTLDQNSFIIRKTDFGIQEAHSHFELDRREDGRYVLVISIVGGNAGTDLSQEVDDDEWNDTPSFQLGRYLLPAEINIEDELIVLVPLRAECAEFSLGMWGHNPVSEVKIQLHRFSIVEIDGSVHFREAEGGITRFRIVWCHEAIQPGTRRWPYRQG